MAGVIFNSDGKAVIFDRVTGEVIACSVPTALENVVNGQGRFVHGATGDRIRIQADGPWTTAADPEPLVADPDASIPLRAEDTLPLPVGESNGSEIVGLAPAVDPTAADPESPPPAAAAVDPSPIQPHPLDHDGDGKPGGSLPADEKAERKALFAALKAAGQNVFAGTKTDKLREMVAAL